MALTFDTEQARDRFEALAARCSEAASAKSWRLAFHCTVQARGLLLRQPKTAHNTLELERLEQDFQRFLRLQ